MEGGIMETPDRTTEATNSNEAALEGCCDPRKPLYRFVGLALMCLLGFGKKNVQVKRERERERQNRNIQIRSPSRYRLYLMFVYEKKKTKTKLRNLVFLFFFFFSYPNTQGRISASTIRPRFKTISCTT